MDMQCPRCSTDLAALDTAEGPTLDFCSACGGTWFDAGEVEQLVGLVGELPAPPEEAPTAFPCPRCAEPTRELHLPNDLRVDVCTGCGGVWLDKGEVALLRRLSRKPAGFAFVQGSAPRHAGAPQGPRVIPVLGPRLDWFWVFAGLGVMLLVEVATALLVQIWLAADTFVEAGVTDTRFIVITLGVVLGFSLGGFVVGWRSRGFTVWEPAIAAFPGVIVFLLLFGQGISWPQILGLVGAAVVSSLLGAALGERFQAA